MDALTLFTTFGITVLSLMALRPVAARAGLMDRPGGRKHHRKATPLIGGLGIYLGILCATILSPIVVEEYLALLTLSAMVLLVGILDDMRGLNARFRLLCQAGPALLMAIVADNQLTSLGDIVFIGTLQLGLLAVPLTVFATVGVINAINMSDGLDGLSGGLVVIALGFLSLSAMLAGETSVAGFSQILLSALLAFMLFNFRMFWKKHAMVYLGDAGSTLLGFVLAWLVIAASQGNRGFIEPVYMLWFLAVPLIDTVSLLIRRPLRGRSPFRADRDHMHHRLLASGLSSEQTVLVLFAMAIMLGAIGLSGHLINASESLMFCLFMTLFAGYMFATRDPVPPEQPEHGSRQRT